MQLLQNLGFKTAAMALRDDSVGLMTKHSVQKKKWQSFSELKVTALHHRPCRLRLYSKDTNVPRSRFVECSCGKCSGILGAGTQVRYNSGGNEKMSLEKAEKYLEEKGFLDHVIELEASTATVTEAAAAFM